MRILLYLGFGCLLILFACQPEGNSTGQNLANSTPVDPRPPVLLQTLYATVTALNSDVGHLLDGDPSTLWRTPPGAGPGEGITLEFLNPRVDMLHGLELVPASGDSLATIRKVSIYLNGLQLAQSDPGEYFSLEGPVEELRIQIAETAEEQLLSFEEKDRTVSVKKFSPAVAVGLSALRLYGPEGREYRLVPPRRVRGRLIPTSNLNPLSAYHAGLLFDGRRTTAWVGGSEGAPGNDSILIQLESPISLTDIRVWNGYQLSPAHFAANGKVRRFAFAPAGAAATIYDLRNSRTGQPIRLNPEVRGREFIFQILEIYRGERYRDLAISELVLLQAGQPILIESELADLFREELLFKCRGTVLEALLNIRIYNEIQSKNGDFFRQKSLVLHTDGSFVAELSEFLPEEGETRKIRTDGHWQIRQVDAETATIELFGRLLRSNDSDREEKRLYPAESGELFSDLLTINGNRVESARFLGTFYAFP